jgi:hypothetical protein
LNDDETVKRYDASELDGFAIERVAFDWQVRLLLLAPVVSVARQLTGDKQRSAELIIEGPIELADEMGSVHQIRPGELETLVPAIHFLRRVVDGMTYDGRTLEVRLDCGCRLRVSSDSPYEAWQIIGQGVGSWIATRSALLSV